MNYYVYSYKTPVNISLSTMTLLAGASFYIGKGKGKRYRAHLNEKKKLNHIKHAIIDRIRAAGFEPIVEILFSELSNEDAKLIEISTISHIGRISKRAGTLSNLTDGGDGATGLTIPEETRKRWSEMRKGRPSPLKGTKRPGVGGRKKGTKWSAETREKMKEIRSRPGFFDYKKTEASRKKNSDAHRGRIGTATGKKWFTNGIKESYHVECPEGYRQGRKPGRSSMKAGMCWFNNGEINRQFRLGEELEGFVRGRISKK